MTWVAAISLSMLSDASVASIGVPARPVDALAVVGGEEDIEEPMPATVLPGVAMACRRRSSRTFNAASPGFGFDESRTLPLDDDGKP